MRRLPERHSRLPYSERCNWQVAKWLAIDSRAVVLHAPRLLQAACAASTDVYVYLLARQRFGRLIAGWACMQSQPAIWLIPIWCVLSELRADVTWWRCLLSA